ncbi:hypothetical protein HELRODRAFT_98642 [Helobdella robusta]|uniref:dihydrofolate reductase n=1 Tax=Helobdella robusta TaxID=6412 RepID=T1G9P0_HELRO|nr:hypothetical protein HELRODRAFT_98642 [Helobdella robusta]ESO07293.1 hypothetical protein HELRODRAFT_98642 [Helobdella robusta]
MQPKLQIIVALCVKNRGIGLNNSIPWKLPGDMTFFRKLTSETSILGSKNAILMGRKTWDSIPSNLKPLKNRLNVVISRTLECPDINGRLHVSKSFEDAVEFVASDKSIDKIFIIGGSSIYDLALASSTCYNVFITEISNDFQCDTFFPKFNQDAYKLIKYPGHSTSVQLENGIGYQFTCHHKIRNTVDDVKNKDNLPIYSVVAMDNNRGIGYENHLPWPYIDKDYKHLISLLQGKTAIIVGRLTWESMKDAERHIEGAVYIVVGSKKHLLSYPDLICSFVPTLVEAVCLACDFYDDKLVTKICFLGGSAIYKEAIESGLCETIYLTRIDASYVCNVFMPDFESEFILDTDYPDDYYNVPYIENGIQMTFQVYKKK